ncbi:rubrerythrin family protein [archaeon]|nr:rubrerythrin family protein [archaeon]
MVKTKTNLEEAFAGESQANRKYLAFAKKAEKEGLSNIARLFRAAADSETMHAMKHLQVMRGIKDTEGNLREAIEGETYELTSMYPQMIDEAEAEGETAAKMSFEHANAAEKVHAKLFEEALSAVESGGDIQATDYYVCQICGFAMEGEAPNKCPVCGATSDHFKKIE